MIIYLIRNKLNNKCYVGLDRHSGDKRWKDHLRRSRLPEQTQLIDRKIKEYGESSFEYQVLCECHTIDELKEREVYFIEQYNSFVGNGHGYNLTLGGDGCFGFKMTESQIAKNKGENHYFYGQERTDAEKLQRSLAMKGKNSGDNNVFKRSEVRARLSELAKARVGKLNPNYRHGNRIGVNKHEDRI